MKVEMRGIIASVAVSLLLIATGCGPKNTEADQKPPTTESAMKDSRIPPAQKAALEQNIAQQKTSANWLDEKMKANAARKP